MKKNIENNVFNYFLMNLFRYKIDKKKKLINKVLILFLTVFIACQKPIYVTSIDSNNSSLAIAPSGQDKEIMATIEPYKAQLDEAMNMVIGNSKEELVRAAYQSPLANFVVDLVLIETQEIYNNTIDMALITNGGLRTSIPKGDVTMGNIYELMPFENEIVVLTLEGETMLNLLHYAAFKGNAVFSGVAYKVKNGQTADIFIGDKPFDYDKTYTLAVSDYLAGGGDNMYFLKNALSTDQTGLLFRDAIINHIKKLTAEGKQIISETDDRVTLID